MQQIYKSPQQKSLFNVTSKFIKCNRWWEKGNSERFPPLVGKPVFLLVAQLVEVGGAGKVDHGWRATHEHEVVSGWRKEVILDDLGRNEAHAVLPGWNIGKVLMSEARTGVFFSQSDALSTVYHTLNWLGCSLATSSNSLRRRMSDSDWLAKMRRISVLSLGSLVM